MRDEYFVNAARLAERGWLSRRLTADDIVWELTDRGMANLELGAPMHFTSKPN